MQVETFKQNLKNLKIVVVGDLIIDRYIWGQATRISPEAPVPVVEVEREEDRLGGAANVALNLKAIGVTPLLCGAIGDDRDGERFLALLNEQGFSADGILMVPNRPTTVKSRIISQNQQMLRLDRETRAPLSEAESDLLAQKIELFFEQNPRALIFEDYDKGVLSQPLIRRLIGQAKARDLWITVDPKADHFWDYAGVSVFKPNVKELNQAVGKRIARNDLAALIEAANVVRQRSPHDYTFITLSEHGVLWISPDGGASHFTAHLRQIVDVSGAGDTVIAALTASLAAGLSPELAPQAANLAGGLVCENVGVTPIDSQLWFNELLIHKIID